MKSPSCPVTSLPSNMCGPRGMSQHKPQSNLTGQCVRLSEVERSLSQGIEDKAKGECNQDCRDDELQRPRSLFPCQIVGHECCDELSERIVDCRCHAVLRDSAAGF